MANSGGTYVVRNGKKTLIHCTRPAASKNSEPTKAKAEPVDTADEKSTEEQAKA